MKKTENQNFWYTDWYTLSVRSGILNGIPKKEKEETLSKILKVSDKTHELVMSLRGEGESVDDVIASRLQMEVETPIEKVTRELFEFKAFLTNLQKKNSSEATPQVSTRKTAGGGRPPADTFTATDEPEDPEKPCCKRTTGKQPCEHWEWLGDRMEWKNRLSNRIIVPGAQL